MAEEFLRIFTRHSVVRTNVPPEVEAGTGVGPDKAASDTSCSVVGNLPYAGRLENGDTGVRGLGGDNRKKPSILPFDRLGHYEVVGCIGRGGMGDVYRGYERALDRSVALKVLPTELSTEPELVRRFYAEASAAARVIHPHVIPIHFIGEDEGRHYFAMQYVEGESLAELLARRERLGVDETLDLLEQVLSGLGAAHRQGLIHRDIKPGNILLDGVHQRALLADFGLVKSLASMAGRTATGVVMGTVDYIAPEQGRGLPVDSRSDLYAVGVLAYQMLSGRLPFSADSPTALIFQHFYEPVPPLGDDVPPAVSAVVSKLMAKSREARHASAEAVLADLQAIRAGCPLPSRAEVELAANPQVFLQATSGIADPLASTHIIAAPQFPVASPFPDNAWLSDELQSEAASGWWSRLLARWKDWLRTRTPEWMQQAQSTQQQVDGAVAEYEHRREQLQSLACEAESVLTTLHAALSTQPEDVNLQRAVEDQQEQLEEMRMLRSQVEATLRQLSHQRDLLQARLKAAHARFPLAGRPSRNGGHKRIATAVVIASCLLASIAFLKGWFGAGGLNLDSAAPDVPLVTEILKVPVATADLSQRIETMAFGNADALLGIVKPDASIELWDGNTGQLQNQVETGQIAPGHVMIDHDGNHAASLTSNGQVASLSIWDTRQGSQSVVATDLHSSVRLLGFAGTPSHVLLAQRDASQSVLIQWPLDGTPPVRVTGMPDLSDPVVFDWSGRRFAVGRTDEVLLGELPNEEKSSPTVHSISTSATTFLFHPHDGTVVIGGNDGSITIWDFTRRLPIRQLVASSKKIAALEVDDTGRWLAASDGEVVRIWDLGLMYVRAIIPTSKVTAMAFSPRGQRLAMVRDSTHVQFWNTEFALMEVDFKVWFSRIPQEKNSQILNVYPIAGQTFNPREAKSRDGSLTVAAPGGKIPLVKETKSGHQIYEFEGARPSSAISLSADDQLVAIGSYDGDAGAGDIRMWNLETGQPIGAFYGHVHNVRSLAFSNDETRLLSGGNGLMHLWDVKTQKEVRRFKVPFQFVSPVAFSHDGKRATASSSIIPMVAKYALFDINSGEPLMLFSGLPPEFVFNEPEAYTDQRFGTVREMNIATKPATTRAPRISEEAKNRPRLPLAAAKPAKRVVKVAARSRDLGNAVSTIDWYSMTLPLSLTNYAAVAKEIGLTDEQKQKLTKLRKEAWDNHVKRVGALPDFPDDATETQRRAVRAKFSAAQNESAKHVYEMFQPKLAEILDARQFERVNQIAIQVTAEFALLHPVVNESLKLSRKQQDEVAAIHNQRRVDIARIRSMGNVVENMARMQELHLIRLQELDAVLSAEQREQFQKMKGEEFDILRLIREK